MSDQRLTTFHQVGTNTGWEYNAVAGDDDSGAFPVAGLTFTDNGNGTATISGTPTKAQTKQVIIAAKNVVLPNTPLNDLHDQPVGPKPSAPSTPLTGLDAVTLLAGDPLWARKAPECLSSTSQGRHLPSVTCCLIGGTKRAVFRPQ